MSKKLDKFLFLDGADSIYSAKVDRTMNNGKTTLFHSRHGNWANLVKGKSAVVLKEDGNGVDVKFKNDGPSFRLDYSQFVELQMALDAHSWSTYKKAKL